MFQKVTKTDMELIAVIREPISWLGSWYRYRRRAFMRGKPNATHDMTFDAFVKAHCQDKVPGFANVGTQAKFIEPRPNGVAVSRLFRYEDPDTLLAFLQSRLSTSISLERLNVSPDMDLTLSAETDALMRHKCAEDFAIHDSIP